ncbi:MAG: hypothetical protein H6732_16950, partial [Alphaproteobacteria bacterium]|nr:hypothetical protein [Alphaproteobacteria bacterium]
LDGRIDGPVLRGLQAEVPRGMVEDELGAALVDVGVPRVIARAWAKAAERAWAKQWRKWTLPPTKAFPSFAAVAAPEAPPTEAEPFPLRPDASRAYGELSPEELYVDLADRLGDLLNLPGLPEAVKAWATRVGGGVAAWSEQATLGGIWGQGPVPAFAPPYVPVGPVIAGDNVAAPGHGSAVGVVRPSLAEVVARAKG